jgi:heterodisulfide reductase subunit C
MSVLERLKALFSGAKNDVSEKKSDKEVLNREKPEKTESDLKTKQTSQNDTKVEEKTETSQAETSEPVETTEEEVAEEVQDEEVQVEEEELEEDNDKKDEKDNMTLLDEENGKLTLDSVDPDFTQIFIDAGIDTVEHCFQCGTCTGGCPSGRRTPYRIRQIVRKCLMGLKDEVINDDALWMCTTCYTCQERCPREIKIVEIVKMARNVAAQSGQMAPAHKATGSFVIKTGHGVPINDATMELRKRVGLDELPPTTHSFPGALEEVQKICEATGFNDLIGYNKETGELE